MSFAGLVSKRIGIIAVVVGLTAGYSGAAEIGLSEAAQTAPDCANKACAYLDPSLPTDARVKDLIGRMTLEEKVSQMQNSAVAIPRLGIPAYDWWSEALHGVAWRGVATVFPQAIGLAATWDAPLIHRIADTISTEARAVYNQNPNADLKRFYGLTFWSPNVNIFRDPRWGRGQETYGEDPYLTGRLGTQFVLGMQGDDPRYLKVVSTPKHFAVHSGPESLRHRFNVDVSKHDLEDTYLPAFRATIVDGHADSVMCAYNAIDKYPGCASTMLLQDHLVKAWGFNGYVVSDCDAVGDIASGHHFAEDKAAASAVAVKSGTDLDCGDTYKALPDAVKRGLIQQSEIDTSLARLWTARFRLGMFDPPDRVPYHAIAFRENDSDAHRAIALDAARESIVLLKNDGILPLRAAPKRIAVVGPTAEDIEVMHGNYNGVASDPVYAREGIAKQFKGAEVTYALGSPLAEGMPPVKGAAAPLNPAALLDEAVKAASASDLVIAFVGLSPKLEGEEMNVHLPGFDGGDRTTIDLPAAQQKLLEALKKTGKPLIVVLNSGSALAVNWAQANADAVLEAWYPGEEGGDAIAQTIAGDNNPSGRLPITFYRSSADLPPFTDYSMKDRTYRYYAGEVLYPFGFGLSYTKFHYGAVKLSSASLMVGETLLTTVQVRNEGLQDGDEVVQVYLKGPHTELSPRHALVGFKRVHCAAGQTQTVTIPIDARGMSVVDSEGGRAIIAGMYSLSIGGGQPGTAAPGSSAEFKVNGTKTLPE